MEGIHQFHTAIWKILENDRNVEIRYQNRTGYVCMYVYIASISLCDSWSFPLKNPQDLVAQDLIAIMDEAKRPIDNKTKERFGWFGWGEHQAANRGLGEHPVIPSFMVLKHQESSRLRFIKHQEFQKNRCKWQSQWGSNTLFSRGCSLWRQTSSAKSLFQQNSDVIAMGCIFGQTFIGQPRVYPLVN